MNTDVSKSEPSHPEPAAVPTVIIPLNHPEPIDTGIRVPVRTVSVADLARAEKAEQAQAQAAGPQCDPAAKFNPDKLPTDPVVLQRMIAELVAALQNTRQEVGELRQRLDILLRRLYGPRADEWDPKQALLFPEIHPDAVVGAPPGQTPPVLSVPAEDENTDSGQKRKHHKHGRRRLEELLPTLPVERQEHELTEAERICPCCGKLQQKIGEQTTQQLEFEPARLVRIEHAQFTYSCPSHPEHIVTAPKPPQPIDGGLPGPGLLAAVGMHKFDEHQPLYRQELSLWRCGLFLARSTTCGWLAAGAVLLRPLVALMKERILQSRVIQTDGTGVQVQVEGQAETVTGQLWPYLGDAAHPYVVVDFSLDKKKEHPQDFLADYTGYVQADAFASYDGLFVPGQKNPKIEVGCWSHAQRKFDAARASAPELACAALGFVGALFQIEDRAREQELSEALVLTLRQREAVPILDEFYQWLEATHGQVLPKSPLGEAYTYVLNQRVALKRYTEAGFLSIDNNPPERINKIIAGGRNNWLFVGSPAAGPTAGTWFSMTSTCRRLHMDSFPYLRELFTRLPSQPRDRLHELLPDVWLASHPEARYPPQRAGQLARRRRQSDGSRAPP